MKELICIVCPNGCHLQVDETALAVTGNKCVRGLAFAKDEMTNPKRSLTSTVRTTVIGYPVISVRTNGDVPKKLIPEIMGILKKAVIADYCPSGTVVVNNILGTGVDIITTTPMIK